LLFLSFFNSKINKKIFLNKKIFFLEILFGIQFQTTPKSCTQFFSLLFTGNPALKSFEKKTYIT
jgi:hypothetical protein